MESAPRDFILILSEQDFSPRLNEMKHRPSPTGFLTAFLAAAFLIALAGCENESQPQATPLLPEAQHDEKNISPYTPENPYREVQANLLSRTVFQADGPKGVAIEFRDLFVMPGKVAEKISLPGPAVFEVLTGEGKFSAGGKSRELTSGSSVSIAQGEEFSLESKGETSLEIRARLFLPR